MKPPRSRLAAAAIVLAAAPALPAAAVGPGVCYHARIGAPIVLPDGSAHPPGDLELCPMRELSPVSTLERVAIDGRPIGMFVGHRTTAERHDPDAPPRFVFARDAEGGLVLVACTVSDRSRTLVFWLDAPGGKRRPSAGPVGPGTLASAGWRGYELVQASLR